MRKFRLTNHSLESQMGKENFQLPDESTRNARRQKAELFFYDYFIPAVKEGGVTTREHFEGLMTRFRRASPGLGDDFESVHVWAVAQERVLVDDCLAREDPDKLPHDASEVKLAWQLIRRLELETEN